MTGRRIKDALLERYLSGDLPEPLRAQLAATLESSEADRARLAELDADTRAFLTSHPPGPVAAKVAARRERRWLWLLPAIAVPALGVVLLVRVPQQGDEEAFSVKGGVSLAVHVRRASGAEKLRPGEALAPGDAIRFEVRATGAGWVAVVSRDERGAVSVYVPFGGAKPERYDPAEPVLQGAVELDDAPGREELYALVSAAPFELAPVLDALRAGRALEPALPAGVAVGRAQLVKRAP